MDNHFNDFFKKRRAVSPFLFARLYDTFMLVYVNRPKLVFLIVFSFFFRERKFHSTMMKLSAEAK